MNIYWEKYIFELWFPYVNISVGVLKIIRIVASFWPSLSLYLLGRITCFSHITRASFQQLRVGQMLRRWRAITTGAHATLLLPWWLGCGCIYNCVCFCCFGWLFAPLYYFSMSVFEGIESFSHLFDEADEIFLFLQSLFQQLILFWCLFSLIRLSFLTWSWSR